MPKYVQPSTEEKERYLKVSQDMMKSERGWQKSVAAYKMTGRIIRWRDEDDFGFISIGADKEHVFCHESQLSAALSNIKERIGLLVQFDLEARVFHEKVVSEESGVKRKESACNVILVDEPVLIGRLTWKGTFGFIKCSDGREFFCAEKDFLEDGLGLDTGDVVQFIVHHSGERRARAVRISPSDAVLPAPAEEVVGKKVLAKEANAKVVERGLDGRVIKLNEAKGFGFIRPKDQGKDIYFKIDGQSDLRVGSLVLYSLQDEGGWLSAFDVTPVFPPARKKTMSGMVTSWNEGKGFGFITPDGGECDIFCHRDDVGVLRRGLRVTFTAVNTFKGKKAVDLSKVSHMRAVCRNPACKGAHFMDNCPLSKVQKVLDDDAASEATCSTEATVALRP